MSRIITNHNDLHPRKPEKWECRGSISFGGDKRVIKAPYKF